MTHANGSLPPTWQVARLKGVVTRLTNGYVGPTRDIYLPEGVPYLLARHVHDNRVTFDGGTFVSEEFNQRNRKSILRAGDVLMVQSGHVGETAVVPVQHEGHNCHAMIVISPEPKQLYGPFLSYYCHTPKGKAELARLETGATLPHLNCGDVENLLIPLPPLSEQRRIAAILDKADAIRRKREEGIRLTEELLRSTFLEMFGDPATNPKRWPLRVMGDVVNETQYGTAGKSNSDGRGIPVLRMNNITYTGELDLTDLKWCEIEDADLDQLTVKRGDLLFNRTNSPELVGKTAVWDRDDSYAYAGYLFRVRFDEAVVLPDYVSSFLNSAYGKKMLFAKAKPSNNMSNFSAGVFCRIELPVPDIGLQRRFAKLVYEIGALKKKRRSGVQEASDLFASLVQRAFRGEL